MLSVITNLVTPQVIYPRITVSMVYRSIKGSPVADGRSRAWIKRMAVAWWREGWSPEWDK